jgi:hypothetical protein
MLVYGPTEMKFPKSFLDKTPCTFLIYYTNHKLVHQFYDTS